MSVSCVGDINMLLKTENEICDAVVNNAKYIPELSTNLLSARQLTKKLNKVVFGTNNNLKLKAFVEND